MQQQEYLLGIANCNLGLATRSSRWDEVGQYQMEECNSEHRLYIEMWLEQGSNRLSLHMKASPTATRDRGAEWIGYATIADDLRGCGIVLEELVGSLKQEVVQGLLKSSDWFCDSLFQGR